VVRVIELRTRKILLLWKKEQERRFHSESERCTPDNTDRVLV